MDVAGKGSSFHFTLPVEPPREAIPMEAPPTGVPVDLASGESAGGPRPDADFDS